LHPYDTNWKIGKAIHDKLLGFKIGGKPLNTNIKSSDINKAIERGCFPERTLNSFVAYILLDETKGVTNRLNDLKEFFGTFYFKGIDVHDIQRNKHNSFFKDILPFTQYKDAVIYIEEDWTLTIKNADLREPVLLTSKKRYISKFKGIIHFTPEYWEYITATPKSKDVLLKFYINNNSSLELLPYIIAKQYCVTRQSSFIDEAGRPFVLDDQLEENVKDQMSSVITVNAKGGSGKTTLLFQLGYKYRKKYNTYLIKEPSLIDSLPEANEKHTLVLLDNYAKWLTQIDELIPKLLEEYDKYGFTLLMTEKSWYINTREKPSFLATASTYLGSLVTCSLDSSSDFYSDLFELMAKELEITDISQLETLKPDFIDSDNRTTTVRIFNLLQELERFDSLKYDFHFDWDEWSHICENIKYKPLRQLYMVVAIFNHYEITPKIELCLELLNERMSLGLLTELLRKDLPIQIMEDKDALTVRNPNVVPFFIEKCEVTGYIQSKWFKAAIDQSLSRGRSYNIHFLRNLWRNQSIKNNKLLKELIPDLSILTTIFETYVSTESSTKEAAKTYMELYILYMQQGDKNLAVDQLSTIMRDLPEDAVYAKTKLAHHYLIYNENSKAGELLKTLIQSEYHRLPVLKIYIWFVQLSNESAAEKFAKLRWLHNANLRNESSLRAYILNAMKKKEFHPFYDEIRQLFDELITFNGQPNWRYRVSYLQFLKFIDHQEQFIALLDHIKDQCNSPSIISYLANWLSEGGRNSKAMELISTFKRKNPNTNNHIIDGVHANILIKDIDGRWYFSNSVKEVYEQAVQMLERNSERFPKAPHAWHQLFVVNHLMYKLSNSKYYYHKCISPIQNLFKLNHKAHRTIAAIIYYIKTTKRCFLWMQYTERFAKKRGLENNYYSALIDVYRFFDSLKYLDIQAECEDKIKEGRPGNVYTKYPVKDSLISLGNQGVYFNGSLTSRGGEEYKLMEKKLNVYGPLLKQSIPQDVYFSLHSVNGEEVANNIEPYFPHVPNSKEELQDLIWWGFNNKTQE
jgi:hypothetical protein